MIRIDKNMYINENKIKKIVSLSNSYEITMDDEFTYNVYLDSNFKASIDTLINHDSFEDKYYDLLENIKELKDYIRSEISSTNYEPEKIVYESRRLLGIK